MNKFLKTFAVAAALTLTAGSAQAVVTAVQYNQVNASHKSIKLVNTAGVYTLSNTANNAVTVSIFDPVSLATGTVSGTLNFSASGNTNATVFGSNAFQTLTGGTLSLISTSAINFNSVVYAPGSNILSLAFTGGTLSAVIGGASPTVQVSLPGNGFTSVTSDFLDFPPLVFNDFSISMSAASPSLSLVGGRIANFTASSTGTFAVDDPGGPGGVPEPGTWAMMLAGFGLVGLSRRRNRTTTVAA
jgi:hypothetical protein